MNLRLIYAASLFLLGISGCVDNFQLDQSSSEVAYKSSNEIYNNVIKALVIFNLSPMDK